VKQLKHFFTGTSGVVVPIPQAEYPQAYKGKSRLSYYSTQLNSLEVNSSFYRLPKIATIEKWMSEVGSDFRFTFKIPKIISHAKDLAFNESDVAALLDVISYADKKKGCLLIQLPPSAKVALLPRLQKLLQLFRSTDEGSSWDIAVEFRDPSWYNSKVEATLSNYHACIAIHDHPKAPTPLKIATPLFYLRFHGDNGRYRGSYSEPLMEPYAQFAREQLLAGKKGYCYFNNTMGAAFENAITLREMIRNG
jgi:uncharacterized protein YecE (DUF72 family)